MIGGGPDGDDRLLAVPCDVADPAAIEDLVAAAVARFGAVDGVVNNAAHVEMEALDHVGVDTFDHTFAVNVRGPLLVARTALPHLRESPRGAVVNITSVAVEMGGATMGLYRASKAALAGLTKVMAKEWGPDGVRVNAVSPGKVDTEDAGIDDDLVAMAKLATPLGRLGDTGEIAEVVAWLLGPGSSYVTGATLTVDGGVTP